MLATFLEKIYRDPSESWYRPLVRIMMDVCGSSQGMASKLAYLCDIPYAMHPVDKVSNV